MTWAYIAGFFDGEGSITHNGRGFRISIPQTNRAVLCEIQSFVDYGNVIAVTKRKSHWKESWVFGIARQADVKRFLTHIAPHVVVKRSLVKKTLPILHKFVEHQQRAETFRDHRRYRAAALRTKGLSYRAIGKQLGMDWGWVRRMLLSEAKKHRTVGVAQW